jgi:trimeric autotransporter adhesin
MGHDSFSTNTTGSDNVAIGADALYSSTTSSNNTAVGKSALALNTTGASNTAVGYNSLCANTTGTQNTAVGKGSLSSVTTSPNNTAIGEGSGSNMTTGSGNNTVIGYVAGTDAVANIGSSSNYIVLGNNSNTNANIKIDWTVTSDLRDKMNIESVPYGLDFVNQITPIKYNFKKSRDNATSHGKARFGFKAQEILALEGDNPVLVNNDDEDNLKLTGAYLVPVLVNAIKELKARIETLENK